MKRVYRLAALAALLAFAGLSFSYYTSRPESGVRDAVSEARQASQTVEVAGQIVKITVAQSPEEHQRGLGGRASLAADEGMLFVFPEDGKYSFWMKDMLFSIDILWLAVDGTIVYIEQGVAPDTYPGNFASPGPARYVLELPAGFVSKNIVSVGDIVRL